MRYRIGASGIGRIRSVTEVKVKEINYNKQ